MDNNGIYNHHNQYAITEAGSKNKTKCTQPIDTNNIGDCKEHYEKKEYPEGYPLLIVPSHHDEITRSNNKRKDKKQAENSFHGRDIFRSHNITGAEQRVDLLSDQSIPEIVPDEDLRFCQEPDEDAFVDLEIAIVPVDGRIPSHPESDSIGSKQVPDCRHYEEWHKCLQPNNKIFPFSFMIGKFVSNEYGQEEKC